MISIQLNNALARQKSNTNIKINKKLQEMAAADGPSMLFCSHLIHPTKTPRILPSSVPCTCYNTHSPWRTLENWSQIQQSHFWDIPWTFTRRSEPQRTWSWTKYEIIGYGGGNTYKLPHAGKDAIICSQKRNIPLRLPCQTIHIGGAINGVVIKAYVHGGWACCFQSSCAPTASYGTGSDLDCIGCASILARSYVSDQARSNLGATRGTNNNGYALAACQTVFDLRNEATPQTRC
jgi:hypothetical protein